jgi:hypothetical protein
MFLAPATAIVAVALAGPAGAQWYGNYGWGGWGGSSTYGGDVARGMGVFAAGVGQYNVDTAQATAINAQTAATMNEYLYESFQIARQNYYKKVAAKKQLDNAAVAELERRHLYEPSEADIVSGDALNAILHQFANPTLSSQVIDSAGGDLSLSGAEIKQIPLKFASDGVVISLNRLAARDQWPVALNAPEYMPLREQYNQLVQQVRDRPEDQPVSDAQIVKGIGIMNQIRELARRNLQGRDFAQAENFLKGHVGMLQMARQPDIQQVLSQASKLDSVPLANAVAFMEVFNLGFGAAKTPQEKALYLSIYPRMRELRDRVERELKAPIPTSTQIARANDPSKRPTEVFHGTDWDQLSRTEAPVAAPPVGAEDTNDPRR